MWRTERGGLPLECLYGSGVFIIEQVEELEERLDFEPLTNRKSLCDAEIKIGKVRCAEVIAARDKICGSEIVVPIHVERNIERLAVSEALLDAEQAADLELPRQLH